jgi:hypothetical protein
MNKIPPIIQPPVNKGGAAKPSKKDRMSKLPSVLLSRSNPYLRRLYSMKKLAMPHKYPITAPRKAARYILEREQILSARPWADIIKAVKLAE